MFDPATAAIVRGAPALNGLSAEDLVEELTRAYVDIAAARLAVDAADDQARPDLLALRARMIRLADIYEGQVVLDLFPAQSRSAAFVAGSARQVAWRIDRLSQLQDGPSILGEDALGSDIAAALLYLIAEQPSDALEAAQFIRAAGEPNPIRRALILSVNRLCRGALSGVLELDPETERLGEVDLYGHATDLLFQHLLRGVRLLASAGLGAVGDEAIEQAQAVFGAVRRLSLDAADTDEVSAGGASNAVSIYAGPHHLAALLGRASRTLRDSALVRIPTPLGADDAAWQDWLKAEALRRPFIWPNHRSAIATGYLAQGTSLVMTTPTGSGKTTLATLKIAATLAAGKTVLYLAPTHALVGQVERDLNDRVSGIASAQSIEDISLDDAIESLPDVAVVTPERCFALLTFAPSLFSRVGLLVFDECHLLGIDKPATDTRPARVGRRGIDAMLCLLTFLSINASADLILLSAMVSNGDQVAAWLQTLLGRQVKAFDDKWKPTRQLRACVTYAQSDLDILRTSLIVRKPDLVISALPYGLFSLISGWNPGAPDKLVLRAFASAPVALSKGKGAWVTSNRGVVAAAIASAFADAGLKVIVFCENIRMCVSVAKALNQGAAVLTPDYQGVQVAMRDALIEEIGRESSLYDAGARRAAVHHGELLQGERRLVEEMFRAPDSGVNVLAATSTLAQGLNLPCEVVILAGTDRLDERESEPRSPLAPHEILNALGRAGRAGMASTGLAIVVPAVPLGYDLVTKAVSSEDDLSIVFSESDQCLPLADPLTTLFDEIELRGVSGTEADYLLRRLAISLGDEREGIETFESLARRSLGFYQRRIADADKAEQWLQARKATLLGALRDAAAPPQLPWQEELAAKTGASSAFIANLAAAYAEAPETATEATLWIDWLLKQLDVDGDDFDVFLRPETMGRVFGRAYDEQAVTPAGRERLREAVSGALTMWLRGETLVALEASISGFVAANEGLVKRPTKPEKRAQRARRFALRLVPDISFLCGVLSQVAARLAEQAGADGPAPMVTFLPSLVRHGCDTPYHYLIRRSMDFPSRPAVQIRFDSISEQLERAPGDDWNQVREKVDRALTANLFENLAAPDLDALRLAIEADRPAPQ